MPSETIVTVQPTITYDDTEAVQISVDFFEEARR